MTREGEQEAMLKAEDAFAAMFEFLNAYWREFETATVADVLSDMQPAYGGESLDPAAWHDWLRALDVVRERSGDPGSSSNSP